MKKILPVLVLAFALAGCAHSPAKSVSPGAAERHFKSLKQLTFNWSNAEAYFSPNGKKLIYQGHPQGGCDHMFVMNVDGSGQKLLSQNGGRTTCGFFLDKSDFGDDAVIYSSTHSAGKECPKEHDRSKGYVWDIFKSYDIYRSRVDGLNLKNITDKKGYDAEATACGGKIVFTSARSGDSLHVYTMNYDGSGVKKLTTEVGYNGGPFFSQDCKKITYRAYHPKTAEETAAFSAAVRKGYIPPGNLEVYVMNADGSKKEQVTNLETASFAPSFYPDSKHVIFSSPGTPPKDAKPGHRAFQLWAAPVQGTSVQKDLEQITTEGSFNGFPMFSPDGKYLVFASNRNSANPHELQVFIAEWQD